MRICFRVDASQTIGIGHAVRCVALAEALREQGAAVYFVCSEHVGTAADVIEERGFAVAQLPADEAVNHVENSSEVSWQRDAERTQSAIEAFGAKPDWLIVDHYALDHCWESAMRSSAGQVMVVDDLADRTHNCDLLVDHNFAVDHRLKYTGRVGQQTPILGGPRFALLRSVYSDAPRYRPRPEVESIGIFMGGTDESNLSETALDACRSHVHYRGPIEIATTRKNPNLARLRRAAQSQSDTTVTVDQSDLAAFFARHDLQIGAGGGATWERCCIGAPTLTLAYAENQRVVLQGLQELGILATPKPARDLSAEAIGGAVSVLIDDFALRKEMAERSQQIVDGFGARRVGLYLMSAALSVRPAGLGDAEKMYHWRNHPVTRAMSGNDAEIAYSTHVDWLNRTLADTRRTLLIGSVGCVPVGVIRFDRLSGDATEVSLYLDPGLHGLRLGKALLLAGEAFEHARRDTATRFVATVLEQNVGSRRMFESAGYRYAGDRWTKTVTVLAETIP